MADLQENTNEKVTKTKSIVKNIIFDWVIPIAVALVIAMLIQRYWIFKVKVPTGSMIPTIQEEDRLYATRIYNLENIERGDIIIFESKELDDTLIKRLIGLPGDKIEMKDGVVTVNGEVLADEYVKNKDYKEDETFEVPEGKYFFLGDNRSSSFDSSKWKNPYIDGSDIKGKAQIRVFPFSRFGRLK